MGERVLFLDIDGVLLCGDDLRRTGDNRYICPDRAAMVQHVCDRAGAVVVVSSTWRMWDECLGYLRRAGVASIHRDWRTAKGRKVGDLWVGATRGQEIADWLAAHPEVSAYAIVDDDSDMLPEQRRRFVQTPFQTGLAADHAERLVALLSYPLAAQETVE